MSKENSKYIDYYLDKENNNNSPIGRLIVNYIDRGNPSNRVSQFLKYRKLFYKHISDIVGELNKCPEGILLPENLGKIITYKFIPKKPIVNINLTLKIRKDTKDNKKLIYHNNIHTDNFVFKIMYKKKTKEKDEGKLNYYALYENDFFYTFKPAAYLTRQVSKNALLNYRNLPILRREHD